MLSPCLGLYYQLSDLAGYRGRCLPSPCLGLYYLLSGLCRIMGEMYAVSLSGSLLPAFRPCWIMGEMFAVSLSGSSTTSFQTLLDNGGDCSEISGPKLKLIALLRGNLAAAMNLIDLSSVSVFRLLLRHCFL